MNHSENDTRNPPRDAPRDAEVDPTDAVNAGGVESEAEPPLSDEAHDRSSRGESSEPQTEVEILRGELTRAERELEAAREEAADMKSRWLRARADLENVRRRGSGEVERAREAGLDSAVLPVLSTYDDLRRALQVADESDPGKILPGIRAVMDALERNLASLGIERIGTEGEPFDPDHHEALSTVPAPSDDARGTIAQVYEAGFTRGDRLVRPARVVVYREDD